MIDRLYEGRYRTLVEKRCSKNGQNKGGVPRMLQRVLRRRHHHARRLRILNGFSLRPHRRIINAQRARRDSAQGRDILQLLGLLHRFIYDGGSCTNLSTSSVVSGSSRPAAVSASPLIEPLLEFRGQAESAPSKVERMNRAFTTTKFESGVF